MSETIFLVALYFKMSLLQCNYTIVYKLKAILINSLVYVVMHNLHSAYNKDTKMSNFLTKHGWDVLHFCTLMLLLKLCIAWKYIKVCYWGKYIRFCFTFSL